MKKSLIIFLACCTCLGAWAGTTDYNPQNPGDPNLFYSLSITASPKGAGSTNLQKGKYQYGTLVSVSARANTGYQFRQWMLGDSVVSTDSYANFTMPAEDAVLTAYFDYVGYNPQNPDDPFIGGYQHRIYVYSKPSAAGYSNISNTLVTEGKTQDVYAYTRAGYRFVSWKKDGKIISTQNPLTVTMDTADMHLTAQYVYDPSNPGNPHANSFSAATGELVVDDFKASRLSEAIYQTLGDNLSDAILYATIVGVMNSSDLGLSYNMPSCKEINLARTSGYSDIPSYCFNGMQALTKVMLPSTIATIGERAFDGCSQLQKLVCYAMTPPVLASEVFGNTDNLKVYVPSAVLNVYKSAAGWKDLTLLPLDEETCALTVQLPKDAADGRYQDMFIVLKDISSGQTQKYVIKEQTSYTYYFLTKESKYSVQVQNSQSAVLGVKDEIMIAGEDTTIVFDKLLQPRTTTVNVLLPSGEDVTSQVDVTWRDEQDTYIEQSSELSNMLEGTVVKYAIALSDKLGKEYVCPAGSQWTVKADNNLIICTLEPLQRVVTRGRVIDKFQQGVAGLTVSLTQKVNEKYDITTVATTNSNGEYVAETFNGSLSLVVSGKEIVTQTIENPSLQVTGDTMKVEDVVISSLIGTTFLVNFTYQPSVAESEPVTVQRGYEDYQNVRFEIYNATTGKTIEQMRYSYPKILIVDAITLGDSLVFTAKSANHSFKDVSKSLRVSALSTNLTIPIVQWGALESSYNYSRKDVVGMLYQNGYLLKMNTYSSDQSLSFNSLQDGEYQLVSMTKSQAYNAFYDIRRYAQAGLVEGVDYVQSEVQIQTGRISQLHRDTIPYFNELKMSLLNAKHGVSVSTTSPKLGDVVTFTCYLEGADAYLSSPDVNVNFLIDLPSSVGFVANSVMIGSKMVSNYEYKNNSLSIPVNAFGKKNMVKFCVVPTQTGELSINAMANVADDVTSKLISLGVAALNVKDIEINVPSVTRHKTITITGIAPNNAEVEVYDDEQLIGRTKAAANGSWTANCTLVDPEQQSIHSIYAKVVIAGREVLSPTRSCTFDKSAIVVSDVTMYHWNPETRKNYKVVFDFLNPNKKPSTYVYYIFNREFTFTINFTDNDTTSISNVTLWVLSGTGNWTGLDAEYDESKGMWFAKGEFGNFYDNDIPVSVNVDYVYVPLDDEVPHGDAQVLRDAELHPDSLEQEIHAAADNLDALLDSLYAMYEADVIDQEKADQLEAHIYDLLQIEEADRAKAVDENDEELLAKNMALFDSIMADSMSVASLNLLHMSIDSLLANDSTLKGLKYMDISGMNEEGLLLQGYEKQMLDDSSYVFVRQTDQAYEYINLATGVGVSLDLSSGNPLAVAIRNQANGVDIDQVLESIHTISENLGILTEGIDKVAKFVEAFQTSAEIAYRTNSQRFSSALKATLAFAKTKNKSAAAAIAYVELKSQSKNAANAMRISRTCMSKAGKVTSVLGGKVFAVFSIIPDIETAITRLYKCVGYYQQVPKECKDDQAAADAIRGDIFALSAATATFYAQKVGVAIAGIVTATASAAALAPSFGLSAAPLAASLTLMVAKAVAEYYVEKTLEREYLESGPKWLARINKLKCNKNEPKPQPEGLKPYDGKPTTPSIDPSGYVYEGVSSNRIPGATALCYYKDTIEDTNGDLVEHVALWDASEFDQENPLYTDENGFYQWFVPQGLWQVKLMKEGYETTYSDWLPVPPPQLEVNLAMVQNSQPEVENVVAYKGGVVIDFNKYMLPSSLDNTTIYVLQGDKDVAGTITYLDEEESYIGTGVSYVSRVRFTPDEAFSAQKITLVVSNRVTSYANVRMAQTYMQTFDIEQEIVQLIANAVDSVGYGDTKRIRVTALPPAAAAGKTLQAASSSPMLVSLSADSYAFDTKGSTYISISGNLPGNAGITLSIPKYNLVTNMEVKVLQNLIPLEKLPMPNATIESGSRVEKGTEVTLWCDNVEGIIYYTIDGSSPLTSETRMQFDVNPIVISKDMDIRAVVVANGYEQSDEAVYSYIVNTVSTGLEEVNQIGTISKMIIDGRLLIRKDNGTYVNVLGF